MTVPDSGAVVLQFIREELGGLRNSMHDELAAIRADISSLSQSFNSNVNEHGKKIAVLEHQINEANEEIDALKADKKASLATRVSITVAVICAALSWVPDLVSAFSK